MSSSETGVRNVGGSVAAEVSVVGDRGGELVGEIFDLGVGGVRLESRKNVTTR